MEPIIYNEKYSNIYESILMRPKVVESNKHLKAVENNFFYPK